MQKQLEVAALTKIGKMIVIGYSTCHFSCVYCACMGWRPDWRGEVPACISLNACSFNV